MPFIARRKGTGERIDITALELPREELQPGEYVCQICGADMVIKAEFNQKHHFEHVAGCTDEYQNHPESPAHREARRFLATYLREIFRAQAKIRIEHEVPLREVMHVADLVVTFPTGWQVAHEVQLTAITTEQLQKRTSTYALAGIDVVWWLGNSANTSANRTWSRATFGHALVLDIPQKSGNQISLTAFASSQRQVDRECGETVLPASWFRATFPQRWTYARQMRNDPRLLNVIRLFASRMHKPCPPPAGCSQATERQQNLAAHKSAGEAPSQFRIVQQIASNPVVQEVARLFEATLTDIELVQNAPFLPAQAAAPSRVESSPAATSTLDPQSGTYLPVQGTIDELQTQLRSRD